ncbi:phage baseplate assembly protein domain-containing protein [Hansschlegelia zhihuaiae]|nr:phage baseplate assembly protein [Hansschlegelia zhihuaiae]
MSGRLFRVALDETDDSGDQQTATLLGPAGETLKQVHRVQPFGFHSSPPKGSHGVGLQFGGGPDGGRLLAAALGLESPAHRPKDRPVGSTIIYDMHGNAVSLVQAELRIVGVSRAVIAAPVIVLEGTVHLGGEGGQQVHRKGDMDSDGDTAVDSATKVYAL